jgi:hypothetical protein
VSQIAYTHCPNCFAEYRAGYTICQDCGSILEPGPSPTRQRTEPEPPGGIQVVERTEDGSDATTDRFELEEVPVVLTTIVEDDADDFLAALDDQEIGARRGEPAGDGGVEIVVHAANLIDAQAALVERDAAGAQAALLVSVDELERARGILGIEA